MIRHDRAGRDDAIILEHRLGPNDRALPNNAPDAYCSVVYDRVRLEQRVRADARAAVYQDSWTDVYVPPNTHGPRVAPNFRPASYHSVAGDAHALGALDLCRL